MQSGIILAIPHMYY